MKETRGGHYTLKVGDLGKLCKTNQVLMSMKAQNISHASYAEKSLKNQLV